MPLTADQVLKNRYRITALLGKGNFGAVYYAWDLNLNSPVAVKELVNASPEVTHQFSLEARALANLRHPNLPYVIDHFSLPGSGQFLVMEFAEGENLQSLIQQSGRGITEAQALPWMRQVCDALSFLHSQSPAIIHRDVKPANIRIASDGKAMLVDFGITRTSDPTRRTTILAGGLEAAFVSPELQKGVADECSDIYSLGATLYMVLTGAAPPDALKRQTGQALIPTRQINPNINPRTEAVIFRAMELAPERRYRSVKEFATALNLPASGAGSLPTQGVQGYTQQRFPTPSIPPTIQVKPQPTIEYDQLIPPQRRESRKWIIWVAAILGAVCLLGGVVSGLSLYTIFYSTVTPTPTPSETIYMISTEDQAATQTAMAFLSISPSPPTRTSPPPSLTPTPIPTWTSVLTLPPSLTYTPTLVPSITPPASSTLTPAAYSVWQPCPGSSPSRLHVGNRAYVGHDPPLANRVRAQPNVSSTILGFLQPGDKMEIIGGPACSDQWVWWQVQSLSSSLTGWTAEGDNTSYWLVPLP